MERHDWGVCGCGCAKGEAGSPSPGSSPSSGYQSSGSGERLLIDLSSPGDPLKSPSWTDRFSRQEEEEWGRLANRSSPLPILCPLPPRGSADLGAYAGSPSLLPSPTDSPFRGSCLTNSLLCTPQPSPLPGRHVLPLTPLSSPLPGRYALPLTPQPSPLTRRHPGLTSTLTPQSSPLPERHILTLPPKPSPLPRRYPGLPTPLTPQPSPLSKRHPKMTLTPLPARRLIALTPP